MSDHETLTVDINGFATRVWKKGTGPTLGYIAGFGGLPRWMPFLDELAKTRTVIVPSGGVCRIAFCIRLKRTRCSFSGLPGARSSAAVSA